MGRIGTLLGLKWYRGQGGESRRGAIAAGGRSVAVSVADAWAIGHLCMGMAHGAWRMAHGAWRMAHGAWCSVVYTDGDGEDLDLDELNDAICFARENPRT